MDLSSEHQISPLSDRQAGEKFEYSEDDVENANIIPHSTNEDLSWFHFKTQIISAIIVGLSMIHAGLTMAFSNLLHRHFSDEVISTFASLSALSTPLGSCLISVTVDRFGRKYNLLFIQISCILTWILVSSIDGVVTLYLSAAFCGLSRGALTATCAAYISEITYSRYRQLFLSLTTAFFTTGVFIVSTLHIFATYKHSALLLSACFAILTGLTYFIVPESPHWLAVFKSNLDDAKATLKKLTPNQSVLNAEWRLIEEKLKQTSKVPNLKQRLTLLKKPRGYKPCLTLIVLTCFQQFCGIYPFTSYTIRSIPKIANVSEESSKQIFLASGIARLIVSFVASVALAKFNQKQLLVFSSLGMFLTSALLLVNRPIIRYFNVNDQILGDWICIFSFVTYLLSGYIGLLGIPWTIIFELLPTEIKGLLGPFLVAFGYTMMALTLKIFPFLYDTFGTYNVFIYVAFVSFAAFVYVRYFIIETKGKSLYEIEKFYSKSKKNRQRRRCDSGSGNSDEAITVNVAA